MKKTHNEASQYFPLPTALVTCVCSNNYNIISVGYVGFACWRPTIVYVGIAQSRYSYGLIKATGDFVVNIPPKNQSLVLDYCGFVSGVNTNKFEETELTPEPATFVTAPLIKECPINIECKVKEVIRLGTHDLFLGEVLTTHIDDNIESNKELFPIILYNKKYYTLGEMLNVYGESGGCPQKTQPL